MGVSLADVGNPGGSAMALLLCGASCGSWESPQKQRNLPLFQVSVTEHYSYSHP